MTDPAARIRAAFTDVSLALMSWQDPPCSLVDANLWLTAAGLREYHASWVPDAPPFVYRPYDPQGEVEPFDVNADWEEKN